MLTAVALLVTLVGMNVDPPSDAEVLRELPRISRNVPFVYEEYRDDITIVKNTGEKSVGPRLFYPLVGSARLIKSRWKCDVYYTKVIQSDFPFPIKVTTKQAQVVYIEKAKLAK